MRWLISWMLYYAGCVACWAFERLDGGIDESWLASWLFELYQDLMYRACVVQGEGPGPWHTVNVSADADMTATETI
ncbi:MAG: hypothetical protein VX529_11060 [Pseudomonadota bacterium]|nr:hypothetical protein [Pseudomonadota bacterium]